MAIGRAVTRSKRRTTATLTAIIVRVSIGCGRSRHDAEEGENRGDGYQQATDNVGVVDKETAKAATRKYKGNAPNCSISPSESASSILK